MGEQVPGTWEVARGSTHQRGPVYDSHTSVDHAKRWTLCIVSGALFPRYFKEKICQVLVEIDTASAVGAIVAIARNIINPK